MGISSYVFKEKEVGKQSAQLFCENARQYIDVTQKQEIFFKELCGVLERTEELQSHPLRIFLSYASVRSVQL